VLTGHTLPVNTVIFSFDSRRLFAAGAGAEGAAVRIWESVCQEDVKASCCTRDEGGPFGAAL
jgi:hypothetical protein